MGVRVCLVLHSQGHVPGSQSLLPDDTVGKNVDYAYFINGVYTTPAAGVYHCCASFRCKNRSYCDFTVIRNANQGKGDVVWAAFGTRTPGKTNEWETSSTCWTSRCGAGVSWKINFES